MFVFCPQVLYFPVGCTERLSVKLDITHILLLLCWLVAIIIVIKCHINFLHSDYSSDSSISTSHHIHLPKIPKAHHHQREPCDVSWSELMSLAKFSSPAVAEEVKQWLGKRGHLHNDTRHK